MIKHRKFYGKEMKKGKSDLDQKVAKWMHSFSERIKRLHFKLRDLTGTLPPRRLTAARKKSLSMGER